MKQTITVFLCFSLAISIVTPSVLNAFYEIPIEIVDLTDDEDTQEQLAEKELKDLFTYQLRELAVVRIEEKQSLRTFMKLLRYDAELDITVPPPRFLA